MSQQINLLNPVLLTQKRYFSALTVLQALGLFLTAGIVLSIWLAVQASALREETQKTSEQYVAEKARLLEASKTLGTSTQVAAMEQELARARTTLVTRRQVRAELTKGVVREGYGHAALLRTLAATVPAQMWLTEVRATEERIEISGNTLDPAVLNDWMKRLSATNYFAGRTISAVKVVRVAPAATVSATATGVPVATSTAALLAAAIPLLTTSVAPPSAALVTEVPPQTPSSVLNRAAPPGAYTFSIAATQPEGIAKLLAKPAGKSGGPAS